jgi:hypothetical protein
VLKPEEGQLLTRAPYGHAPKAWAYDIDQNDTPMASALRALWDDSVPSGFVQELFLLSRQ